MVFNKLYFWISPILLGFFYTSLTSSISNQNIDIQYVYQEKAKLQQSISRGNDIYVDFCMQCHLANGKGDLVNIPPLDGSDWLTKKRKLSIQSVKFGQNGPITVNGKKFNNIMPPLGLSNQEVADVMNYIMNSWSNKQKKMVTIEEVAAVDKL
ncbi:MAG: cytochrome C [Flavobacterium sp.]|nr:cytochrome C [Flavobacterium sp.]